MTIDTEHVTVDTVYFSNGDYYEGEVLDRVPHGEGTMFYYDGNETLTCRWVYGSPVKGNRDERILNRGDEFTEKLVVGGKTFCVGFGYDKDFIADAFSVNRYIQGIRFYRDNCLLFVVENSVYEDSSYWEVDSDGEYIFIYTGKGQKGDQEWNRENLFLKQSSGKTVGLFIKRKPSEYVFHGIVAVKRIETAVEKDKTGTDRKVFKFILRRV